jgi:hypothetical protein
MAARDRERRSKRSGNDSSKLQRQMPQAVSDYNACAVDMHDRWVHMLRWQRQYMTWWHVIFFQVFYYAVVNSFIMYNTAIVNTPPAHPNTKRKADEPQPMAYKEFVLTLANELIGDFTSVKRPKVAG